MLDRAWDFQQPDGFPPSFPVSADVSRGGHTTRALRTPPATAHGTGIMF
jgi:hypothetical protein